MTTTPPTPRDAGSQLFNSYGPRSNDNLLLGYTMVAQDDPDDDYVLDNLLQRLRALQVLAGLARSRPPRRRTVCHVCAPGDIQCSQISFSLPSQSLVLGVQHVSHSRLALLLELGLADASKTVTLQQLLATCTFGPRRSLCTTNLEVCTLQSTVSQNAAQLRIMSPMM